MPFLLLGKFDQFTPCLRKTWTMAQKLLKKASQEKKTTATLIRTSLLNSLYQKKFLTMGQILAGFC